MLKMNRLAKFAAALLVALPTALAPVAAVFVAWDLAATAAGHWSFDPGRVLGAFLPGGLPIEEVLFFLVVPLCSVLGFEAVRSVLADKGEP